MSRLILVTGGAGFIGSHLVDALLGRGDRVRVLDDFSTGRRENLAQCLADVELLEGDVRDPGLVARAVAGCDGVLHEAAVASVALSLADPVGAGSVTHGGTVNVATQARRAGVGAFVLASSCAVYGDTPALPLREDTPPRPLSPYAFAKLLSEEACGAWRARRPEASRGSQKAAEVPGDAGGPSAGLWSAQTGSQGSGPAPGTGSEAAPTVTSGMRTVCLRYFNVYGPRQDPSSEYSGVIARFVDVAARRATDATDAPRYVIYGDGRQTRDFVYVSDVVAANLLALDACLAGAAPASAAGAPAAGAPQEAAGGTPREAAASHLDGLVLNVGTGAQVSVLEIVAVVERARAAGAARSGQTRVQAARGEDTETGDDLARLVDFRPPREGDVRASRADVSRARAVLGYEPAVSFAAGLAATYEWYARGVS